MDMRVKVQFFALSAAMAMSSLAAQSVCADKPLTWGGIPSHPAVVNPVTGQDARSVMSLRGEWEFSEPARDLPNRNGCWGNFNAKQEWKSARKIQVPACWESQGVGERGASEPWDPTWDCSPKPLRNKYMGEGWYRKKVVIPADWKDKRIWLKVGGVKSIAWIWVNDRQVAHIDNYCATEKFEITDIVKPGEEAKIVVDVDNRKPSRKGLMSNVHRWGGIYRDIELEATPAVFIDDAWVKGDFDKREARVEVRVEKVDPAEAQRHRVNDFEVRATIEGVTVSSPSPSPSPSPISLSLPLTSFRPWSPSSPNLYTAKVELVSNGQVIQTRYERFGVRKLEVKGRDFYLNGEPIYLRGFGDDFVYPVEGMSPADRAVHRAHLAKARAAGFNFVRLHTHCELPEYFEAADELGIMIQAELPYYSDVPCEGFAFDPLRDVTELWRNYRRYPSFCVYSMGNEGSFGPVLDRRIHEYVKAMDPDRLKINQDSNQPWLNPPESSDYCGGPTEIWKRGSFDPKRPFVTHEYMNLCVKLDTRLEDKFSGCWDLSGIRKARLDWLARYGLGEEWCDRLQDAQHALQSVWQKRGVECARADPFCRGYSFWTAVDVVVWNSAVAAYSAQGLFDPFWGTKRRGFSAEDFARFNSPSCVLVGFLPERAVFSSEESFQAKIRMAHYEAKSLVDAVAEWKLATADRVLASGSCKVGDIALGAVRDLASVEVKVPRVTKPCRAEFSVSVGGVKNGWKVWIFPRRQVRDGSRIFAADGIAMRLKGRFSNLLPEERASEAEIVIARSGSKAAREAEARGQRLLTIDGESGGSNVKLGWWWMGDQVGMAVRPHPALGDFPHDGVLDELWFRLVKRGRELPVAGIAEGDMIAVGEGGSRCFLYLAERRGKAKGLVCHGLDILSDTPEGTALLDGFLDWLMKDRWYRGALHTHTYWSDGRGFPEDCASSYKSLGFDFLAITDHNRIGSDTNCWRTVKPNDGPWPPAVSQPVFDHYAKAYPWARTRKGPKGETQVRLQPIDETIAKFGEADRFLIMKGTELTYMMSGKSRDDIHMNCVNVQKPIDDVARDGFIADRPGISVKDLLAKSFRDYQSSVAGSGDPSLFMVNHPHAFMLDNMPEDFLANPSVRFFEVCNNGSEFPMPSEIGDDGWYNDRLWDTVNAVRARRGEKLLYATASDDTHWYPGNGHAAKPHTSCTPGDAWVMVRSKELTPSSLFEAMDRGDYYATCGVELDEIRFGKDTLTVSVPSKPGVTFKIRFIVSKRNFSEKPIRTVELKFPNGNNPQGRTRHLSFYGSEIGQTAKCVSGHPGERVTASYTLQADDLYVRARIESDEPAILSANLHPKVRTAWTQPYLGKGRQ